MVRQHLQLIWQLSNYVKLLVELQCGGQMGGGRGLSLFLSHTRRLETHLCEFAQRGEPNHNGSMGTVTTATAANWGHLTDLTDRCCTCVCVQQGDAISAVVFEVHLFPSSLLPFIPLSLLSSHFFPPIFKLMNISTLRFGLAWEAVSLTVCYLDDTAAKNKK